jgi:hypothetical protein
MSRSDSQRKAASVDVARDARGHAPANPRRERYDSLTRDPAANAQAKREFAEISQRQISRALPAVELDDVEAQQRRPFNFVPPAPTLENADAGPGMARGAATPERDDTPARKPATQEPGASRGASTTPRSKAAPGGAATPKSAAVRPARTESRPTHDDEEHEQAPAHPPSRTESETRGLFVVREQVGPAPALPRARPIAYLPDVEHEGPVFGEYLPAFRPPGLLACLIVAIVSIVVLYWFWESPQVSFYRGDLGIGRGLSAENSPAAPPADDDGQHSVVGAPTITAEVVDGVLAKYGSPAQGTGRIWVELGQRYGIDPAYALAFFIHESSAGTNPGWAGLKPGGGSTHNVGNIICAGYATCFGRFRDYASWEDGIEDWYKLISNEYINGRGANTVEQIIPVYAPASDNNNVPNYVQAVVDLVKSWRQGVIQ